MELFKFSSVEEKALNKLALPTRKLAVDRLRQYFALLFHPDITGLTDSPLARINADLDDLENGKYKSPSNNETESRNISDANEKITQYKKLVSQLQAKLKEKQDLAYLQLVLHLIMVVSYSALPELEQQTATSFP